VLNSVLQALALSLAPALFQQGSCPEPTAPRLIPSVINPEPQALQPTGNGPTVICCDSCVVSVGNLSACPNINSLHPFLKGLVANSTLMLFASHY